MSALPDRSNSFMSVSSRKWRRASYAVALSLIAILGLIFRKEAVRTWSRARERTVDPALTLWYQYAQSRALNQRSLLVGCYTEWGMAFAVRDSRNLDGGVHIVTSLDNVSRCARPLLLRWRAIRNPDESGRSSAELEVIPFVRVAYVDAIHNLVVLDVPGDDLEDDSFFELIDGPEISEFSVFGIRRDASLSLSRLNTSAIPFIHSRCASLPAEARVAHGGASSLTDRLACDGMISDQSVGGPVLCNEGVCGVLVARRSTDTLAASASTNFYYVPTSVLRDLLGRSMIHTGAPARDVALQQLREICAGTLDSPTAIDPRLAVRASDLMYIDLLAGIWVHDWQAEVASVHDQSDRPIGGSLLDELLLNSHASHDFREFFADASALLNRAQGGLSIEHPTARLFLSARCTDGDASRIGECVAREIKRDLLTGWIRASLGLRPTQSCVDLESIEFPPNFVESTGRSSDAEFIRASIRIRGGDTSSVSLQQYGQRLLLRLNPATDVTLASEARERWTRAWDDDRAVGSTPSRPESLSLVYVPDTADGAQSHDDIVPAGGSITLRKDGSNEDLFFSCNMESPDWSGTFRGAMTAHGRVLMRLWVQRPRGAATRTPEMLAIDPFTAGQIDLNHVRLYAVISKPDGTQSLIAQNLMRRR